MNEDGRPFFTSVDELRYGGSTPVAKAANGEFYVELYMSTDGPVARSDARGDPIRRIRVFATEEEAWAAHCCAFVTYYERQKGDRKWLYVRLAPKCSSVSKDAYADSGDWPLGNQEYGYAVYSRLLLSEKPPRSAVQ